MAASVGVFRSGYTQAGDVYNNVPVYNNDPGVYDPECDWGEEEAAYPDTREFIQQQFKAMDEQQSYGEEQQQHHQATEAIVENVPDLPLKGDYQGLGGPQSVPYYTTSAFERPEIPIQGNSILAEIFMEPTGDQIKAYNRVVTKGKVAENKNRLKWSIFMHYSLVFIMISKLMPELLDKFDIFILEVEELFVPKPLFWEWMWIFSVPVTFFGLSACKQSNLITIRRFMLGSLFFSLLPVIIGMVTHASEVYAFVADDDETTEGEAETLEITMWKGYPYSVLWYAFFFLALQVHCSELYFANCLMKTWMPAMKKAQ